MKLKILLIDCGRYVPYVSCLCLKMVMIFEISEDDAYPLSKTLHILFLPTASLVTPLNLHFFAFASGAMPQMIRS